MSRERCFLCGCWKPKRCQCWRSFDNLTGEVKEYHCPECKKALAHGSREPREAAK